MPITAESTPPPWPFDDNRLPGFDIRSRTNGFCKGFIASIFIISIHSLLYLPLYQLQRHLRERIRLRQHGYSERRACKLMDINRRTYRREPAPDRNADLRIRLKELAEERRRFGSPRLLTLLRREGWIVNHKRVERVYRQEGLSLRQRRRRKRPSHLRLARPGPTGANQHWAMNRLESWYGTVGSA